MAHHHLKASVETCHWGYFDASVESVVSIKSGDQITIDTINGPAWVIPEDPGFHVPDEMHELHAGLTPEGPHILTGPVYVEGLQPGHVLEVQIDAIDLMQDWGFNLTLPMGGTLPREFEKRIVNIPLDAERRTARLPWGVELPINPFMGVMGVAPPEQWGRLSTVEPQSFGGNLDNKELVAGATLYLPVYNEGGLFSCGDGHAAQGDGEVNTTAIETALRGTFTLTARPDMALDMPRAETPTHLISMGVGPDLDDCAIAALRDMMVWLEAREGLSRDDAYMLCSLAGDLHVTQTVNGNKGVHMMMPKSLLASGASA